ncbi:hypothetical protein SAMN05216591_2541 [Pseudomonas extremaustralis]|uniref:Uncharacterized protein n=1 Tax=Pseudomonas extremaustralis TaxID=359110 RepID=A0ABY0NDK7_9PSED|nr:hypothetical protein SAMN05216591_2541 [Pseudomonas extremaustralis]
MFYVMIPATGSNQTNFHTASGSDTALPLHSDNCTSTTGGSQ